MYGNWQPTLLPNYNTMSQWVNPEQLTSVWNKLAYDRLWQNLPENIRTDLAGTTTTTAEAAYTDAQKKALTEANKAAGQDIQAGLGWLREAVNVARGATKGSSTRAQQKLAGEHLATLFREAEREPKRAGLYTTLFQNMVNPVLREAPESGIFGFTRSLKPPPGDFRRKGISSRNVKFT
jgi:hypothetical protein